jgi:hypothetical protein
LCLWVQLASSLQPWFQFPGQGNQLITVGQARVQDLP